METWQKSENTTFEEVEMKLRICLGMCFMGLKVCLTIKMYVKKINESVFKGLKSLKIVKTQLGQKIKNKAFAKKCFSS
jgi:hypothetical protein